MSTIESLDNRFKSKSGNFILDLYPPTKLVFALCIAVLSFVSPTYWFGYIVAAVCIALSAYCGKLRNFMAVFLRIFFFFVVLLIICRTVFYTGGDILFSLGPVQFKLQGLIKGLELSSVILSFSSSLMFFTISTDMEDLMIYLERIGVSSEISFIVLSTFQLIPELSARAKTIQDSQKSRGIETEGNVFIRAKAFIPTLGPLLLSSICEAEERSLALESRGFNCTAKKTRIKVLNDSNAQKIVRILAIVITAACIVGGIYIKWIM